MAVGGALFGGGGRQGNSAKSPLVEFRAGKMTVDSDNLVMADERKGLIIIDQCSEQLMHFRWRDRTTGSLEEDLILFPGDVEFKKVPQCTTGRVFVLKFKNSSTRMFFWMQEPKSDKDDDYCKKVNEYLNNPPPLGSSRGGGSSGSSGLGALDLNNVGDSELQSLLSNMNQQQLMQLFGNGLGGASGGLGGLASLLGGGQTPSSGGRQRSVVRQARENSSSTTRTPNPASLLRINNTTSSTSNSTTTTTTTTAPAATTSNASVPTTTNTTTSSSSSNSGLQLSDLQSILSGIKMPQEVSNSGPAVDLTSGISAEVIGSLMSKKDFVTKMKQYLPVEHQYQDEFGLTEELRNTFQSPQFKQAVTMFSTAFQSCQLAPLIREFGFGQKAIEAANKGDLEAFVKALEEDKNKSEADEAPEDMATD